jgi:hypothetical protein
LFDLAPPKQLKFDAMKWILDRIGHLITVRSQAPASSNVSVTRADPHRTDSVPSLEHQHSSQDMEAIFDTKRKELGVEDSLKNLPGVTKRMLIAFGEHA